MLYKEEFMRTRIYLILGSILLGSMALFAQTSSRPTMRGTERSEAQLRTTDRGYRTGYSDGFAQGKDDFSRDVPRDFTRSEIYNQADNKYDSSMGRIEEYQDGYRVGFELGYNDGYFGRPYTMSIPQNLQSILLGPAASTQARNEGDRRGDIDRRSDRPPSVEQQPVDRPDRPTDRVADRGRRNDIIVGDGEELRVRLTSPINTRTNRQGDQFTARVVSPSAYVNATLVGHISKLVHSGKATGKTELLLSFDEITMPDGRSGGLDAQVIKVFEGSTVKTVDEEGNVQSASRTRDTAVRGVGGAALGAIIGGIAGGGKGAAIGAAIGGVGGAGSAFVQDGKEILLDTGTEMVIRSNGQSRR